MLVFKIKDIFAVQTKDDKEIKVFRKLKNFSLLYVINYPYNRINKRLYVFSFTFPMQPANLSTAKKYAKMMANKMSKGEKE